MKTIIPIIALTILIAATATVRAQEVVVGPGRTPLIVAGEGAVEIINNGEIRASASEGFQVFILLVEYNGRTYTCSVTATGEVQPCYALAFFQVE